MGSSNRRNALVAVATALLMGIGLVADVLGIRSALTGDDKPDTTPTGATTTVIAAPKTEGALDPVVDPDEEEPDPPATTTTRPEPKPTTKAPSCLVGTWRLTARTLDEQVEGVGTVRLTLLQGYESRQFRSDGSTEVQLGSVLQGRAANGEVFARATNGSATARYTVRSGSIVETDTRSTGSIDLYRNGVLVNRYTAAIWVDGTSDYTCSSTTLSVQESNGTARYTRQ